MDYSISIEGTPNPNALKFILNVPVKTSGNTTYSNAQECAMNLLAQKLFEISNIKNLYFFENYITVSQDGSADWEDLQQQIEKTILGNIADHNPDFEVEAPVESSTSSSSDPEIAKIDAVLNDTIRPFLQKDGGDVQVLGLEENTITISYQGACGSCPGARMGTLQAIQNILQEQYKPDVIVEMA